MFLSLCKSRSGSGSPKSLRLQQSSLTQLPMSWRNRMPCLQPKCHTQAYFSLALKGCSFKCITFLGSRISSVLINNWHYHLKHVIRLQTWTSDVFCNIKAVTSGMYHQVHTTPSWRIKDGRYQVAHAVCLLFSSCAPEKRVNWNVRKRGLNCHPLFFNPQILPLLRMVWGDLCGTDITTGLPCGESLQHFHLDVRTGLVTRLSPPLHFLFVSFSFSLPVWGTWGEQSVLARIMTIW